MNSFNDSSGLNCSLSDLLQSVDAEFEQPICVEGATIMTKDSIGSPQKNKISAKTSRRASTRKKSKEDSGIAHPLENSLSNLLECDDDKLSNKHHQQGSTKRRTVQQSPSVETMDSVHKAKSSNSNGDKAKSRRGGKKTTTSTSTSLESSLSSMLNDPENSDDDDDDKPKGPRVPRESGTIDSVQRHTKSNGCSSSSGRSKRGGKKETHSNSLSLMCGPPPSNGLSLAGALDKLGGKPKDFGRQADDNDTFCGLGTVGEMEMKKAPLSKQSPRKDKISGKAKVTVSPAFGGTKKKTAATSVPKAFIMSSDDDDSDEEEDLFQSFGANPFRTPYR